MILPNKLFTYGESTLGKFPSILNSLKNKPYAIKDLYEKHSREFLDIEDFTQTLCCLYALNKVYLDEQSGFISYVE